MRTAVFDTITSLRPFFFSLREIKENVSLDIKIPSHWKLGDHLSGQIKIQDQNDKNMLISIVDTATKEGYNEVFNIAKKIIKTNQEEEEKIKLFNATVDGLKDLFMSSSLDKLKELSFIKDGVRDKKSIGETEPGNNEGSDSSGESQTDDD